jgi:beta-glucosidase
MPAAACVAVAAAALIGRAQGPERLAKVPGYNSTACTVPPGDRPWMDARQSPECRALEALAAMTPEERLLFRGTNQRLGLNFSGGSDGPNGITGGGFGIEQTSPAPRNVNTTAFPTVIAVGATWDRDLARRYGLAIGEEFAGKGMSSMTGPTINLLRTWHWGRAAETFSEDPYLMAELAVPEINAMQSQKVVAVVKHFAGNNQENTRTGVSPDNAGVDERISEKALQEIFFPHFKAAVQKAHNASIMCAYNQVNGQFSCNNPWLLGQLREWGFDGYIVPDAGYALRNTLAAARAGVDRVNSQEVDALVKAGQLPADIIDRIAMHSMVPIFRLGIYDSPPAGTAEANVSTPAHLQTARDIGAQGAVLLKNAGAVLPLGAARVKSIAVIGDDAGPHVTVMESGSAHVYVDPAKVRTPLDAITARAGAAMKVTYAQGTVGIGRLSAIPTSALKPANGQGQGLDAVYYTNASWTGDPVATKVEPTVDFASFPLPELGGPARGGAPGGRQGRGALPQADAAPSPAAQPPQRGSVAPAGRQGGGGAFGPRPAWSAVWTGTLTPPASGIYRFSLAGGGTGQLYIDNKPVVTLMRADFAMVAHGIVPLDSGRAVPIQLKYSSASNLTGAGLRLGWQPPDPSMLDRAVAAARQSDVAVVFAAEQEGEGYDKLSLNLPGDEDQLIDAVASANARTIVVLHTSNPVSMPWIEKVSAVIEAWYPGQEAGTSIASVLFGDVNPSGKLPVTFPANELQGPGVKWTEYPGDGRTVDFSEGVLVGYRFYDAKNQQPLFPFGHGLSYTTFGYSGLLIEGIGQQRTVKVRVTNTGTLAGAEVLQLYLGFPPEAGEPPRQLKGFEKVSLKPGESKVVSMVLDKDAMSAWETATHQWRMYPGTYAVNVGSSSRDIRLKGSFVLAKQVPAK